MGHARGDAWMARIQRTQGFDGRPTVVSQQEMDRIVAAGEGTELFRGINGTPEEVRLRQHQFRVGDFYAGNPGNYGSGTYASPDQSISLGYAHGRQTGVMRMALRRDARVIDYADAVKLRPQTGIVTESGAALARKRQEELAKVDPADLAAITEIIERYEDLASRQSSRQRITADVGRLAALLGYDAIIGRTTGFTGMPPTPEYVILNRSALYVQEGPQP